MLRNFFLKNREFLGAAVFIFLGALIVFWGPFFTQSLISSDYSIFGVKSARANPFGGTIFDTACLAGFPMMTGNMYPPLLIFNQLPPALGINLHYLINIFLAGLFAYLTFRGIGINYPGSLAGGIAYGFTGSLASLILSGNINKMDTFLWAPLVFLCVYRLVSGARWVWAVAAGFFMGLMLLGNEPQGAYYFNLLVFLFFAGHLIFRPGPAGNKGKKFAWFILAVMLAIIFAAQPLSNYIGHSRNMVSVNGDKPLDVWQFNTAYSFPPEETAAFFLTADFFGGLTGRGYWGQVPFRLHSDYLGVTTLIFFLAAFFSVRKRMLFFLLGAFSLAVFLAWGRFNPVYGLAYQFPFMNQGRNPIRWLMPASFFWAAMVALGGQELFRSDFWFDRNNAIKIFRLTGLTCLFFLAALIFLSAGGANKFLAGLWAGVPPEIFSIRLHNMVRSLGRSALFCLLGLSGLVALDNFRSDARKQALATFFMLAILLLDLSLNVKGFAGYYDCNYYSQPNPIVKFLKKDADMFRVKTVLPGPQFNNYLQNLSYHGIYTFDAVVSRMPEYYYYFFQRFHNDRLFLELFNVKYLLSGQRLEGQLIKERLAFPDASVYLYQVEKIPPRLFWANRVLLFENLADVINYLNRLEHLPANQVALGKSGFSSGPIFSGNIDKISPPKIIKYSANRVEIDASSSPGVFLYLADAWDPEWVALVDGRPAKIFQANGLFRAVYVPAGTGRLVFKYRPFPWEMYLTGGLWIFFGGFFIWAFLFRKK